MSEFYNNFIESHTFDLVNRPSFWEGFARLSDFNGILNIYNYSKTHEKADIKALKSDWATLNEDMKTAYLEALKHYEQKEKMEA